MILGVFVIFLIWFWFTNQSPDLPRSQITCNIDASWRGISPGQSSRREVIDILGKPQEMGIKRRGDKYYYNFTYAVNEGIIAEYAKDRIFFRLDGIVAWMEIVVGDRNGSYSKLSDFTAELGTTLDTIYGNNNYDPSGYQYDVLGGPDQLYIWSECGLVLAALPNCSLLENGDVKCDYPNNIGTNPFTLRQPTPYNVNVQPPNLNGIVLMKFLFPPTTYEGFVDYYMYKIPFSLWVEYLEILGW